MTIEQVVATIIGSNLLLELVKWLLNRARHREDIHLAHEQAEHEEASAAESITSAADRVVVMMSKQVSDMSVQIQKLILRVDMLETLLARSDYALTYLVRHLGIRKDYMKEVEKAIRIRRGEEKWDDETPLLFDGIPGSE